jgi:hypothetical protein
MEYDDGAAKEKIRQKDDDSLTLLPTIIERKHALIFFVNESTEEVFAKLKVNP